jgi:hypothetical protein
MGDVKMAIKKDAEETTDNVDLNEQNSDLQKQLNEMKLMMEQFMNPKVEKAVVKNNNSIFIDEEVLNVDPHKMVTIISLTNGGLNLKSPKGIKYLRDFGATTRVTFEDLHAIVENHRDFASEGGFLIQDEASVKALYLTEEYSRLISKDRIEKFIDLPTKEIVSALSVLPKVLQETILQKVVKGISVGDSRYSDLNKIKVLNDFSGKDLQEIAKQIAE